MLAYTSPGSDIAAPDPLLRPRIESTAVPPPFAPNGARLLPWAAVDHPSETVVTPCPRSVRAQRDEPPQTKKGPRERDSREPFWLRCLPRASCPTSGPWQQRDNWCQMWYSDGCTGCSATLCLSPGGAGHAGLLASSAQVLVRLSHRHKKNCHPVDCEGANSSCLFPRPPP
jgi:hypothetical protein